MEANIAQAYEGQGVTVITLVKQGTAYGSAATIDDVNWWDNQFNCSHPVVLANDIYWGTAGGAWPTFFVLDQNLQCRYKEGGYREGQLVNLIEELLADPPTPVGGPTWTPEPATATPTPDTTATPEPTPTPTGGVFEGVRLILADTDLQEGDTFRLSAEVASDTESVADFYCALEAFGSYFFYPTWTEAVDFDTIGLPLEFDVLGPFPWPAVAGDASGLRFYGVAVREGTLDYFGEIGMTEFGYR